MKLDFVKTRKRRESLNLIDRNIFIIVLNYFIQESCITKTKQ